MYIADCSPTVRDYLALDYRACGPNGEHAVVHIEGVEPPQITTLASDLASFYAQLRPAAEFPSSIELRRDNALDRARHLPFSALMQGLLDFHPDKSLASKLRHLATEIIQETGSFTLRDDVGSWLLYDMQFLLISLRLEVSTPGGYLHVYSTMLANVGAGYFGTDDYEPQYVQEWLVDTIERGRLEATSVGLRFTAEAELDVLQRLDNTQRPPASGVLD